jgi:NAD(P)-dependent dehydrogenase (short-subunit alcohol dehydrogenase family)
MFSFNGEQRFIVTGASSGLGQGIALLLNEMGATVIAVGRNQDKLNSLKNMAANPDKMLPESKNLTENIEELPGWVTQIKEKYGKLQGLVCSAGIASIEPLQAIDFENMQKMFAINYYAPLFLAKGFADRRVNNGKGSSIVFISSISYAIARKGQIPYCGTKGALISSAKSMGRELAPLGIRVNCVSPGDIKTDMTANMSSDYVEKFECTYPLGFGEVDDVANCVVFLLSDKAKWITTQNYIVDCGSM